jgi:hypothetical protein
VSVGPPAEAGTIAVTGRVGKFCAGADVMPASVKAAAISNFLIGNFPP